MLVNIAHYLYAEDATEAQENKADDLIPQGSRRFHDRRDDVLHKRSALADRLVLQHTHIVTKVEARKDFP